VTSVGILGTGAAIPENFISNRYLEKLVDTTDQWIQSRTGIRKRHIAKLDEYNSDLASKAALEAVRNAGLHSEDVGLVIVATISPDKPFPATANIVQYKIGAKNAASFDINAACSGFLYSIIVGESLIAAKTHRYVVAIGSEIMSRLLNWKDRNTCVLFGDGAGAVVLGAVEEGYGIRSRYMKSNGEHNDLLHQPAGGSSLLPSRETIEQNLHSVQMTGNDVFKHAVKFMAKSACEALKEAGLTNDDITLMIPHQANLRIIEAAARRIKFPMKKVFMNIHEYGNTTAGSIPISIHEAIASGRASHGDYILLVTFGAGFTWGAAVIRL